MFDVATSDGTDKQALASSVKRSEHSAKRDDVRLLRDLCGIAILMFMTTPNTVVQTLERARGLLSHLVDQNEVDQYKARGTATLGSTQLRNMLILVSNIEARAAATVVEDPANAAKRLRDFSKIIERHKPSAGELVNSLRSAADQLQGG